MGDWSWKSRDHEALEELQTAEPEWLFVAVTKVDAQPLPKLVGGFPYRGRKSALGGTIRRLTDQLLSAWPGAKSELTKHAGVEIESITSPALFSTEALFVAEPGECSVVPISAPLPPGHPAVHLAYCDNWFFVATDRALLLGVIDRYLRQAQAGKSLAEQPDFLRERKMPGPGIDLNSWGRWKIVSNQIMGL